MRKESIFRKSGVVWVAYGLLVGGAWGQPKEWSDDFQTVAIYDSASLLAPCYGPSGTPSTKYTIMEARTGDFNSQRLVSGAGRLIFSNNQIDDETALQWDRQEWIVIGALNVGQPCADVADVPFLESTESFTSNAVCMYGGVEFTKWHLRSWSNASYTNNVNDPLGPDELGGTPEQDDDGDGTTDEEDESPAIRATTVNGGYGNADGTGFAGGVDAAPGVAGVDDDQNGTTDNIGETGWPGSDDGDDTPGFVVWEAFLRGNLNKTENLRVFIQINPSEAAYEQPCEPEPCESGEFISSFLLGGTSTLGQLDDWWYDFSTQDEIIPGTFDAYKVYDFAFCARGIGISSLCYGAELWSYGDPANPMEVLGPQFSTLFAGHAPLVGLRNGLNRMPPGNGDTSLRKVYFRRNIWTGALGLSRKLWVISGDPRVYYPSVSADLDNDRDVDGQDFLTFSVCYNGSLRPPQPACANLDADIDGDGDVDGQDFLRFSTCYNGALRRPRCLLFLTACPELEGEGAGQRNQGGEGEWIEEILDGQSPELDTLYVYWPTCTGEAKVSLCAGAGGKLPDAKVFVELYDGVGFITLQCEAKEDCLDCTPENGGTLKLSGESEVWLLTYATEELEDLDGATLAVTCDK